MAINLVEIPLELSPIPGNSLNQWLWKWQLLLALALSIQLKLFSSPAAVSTPKKKIPCNKTCYILMNFWPTKCLFAKWAIFSPRLQVEISIRLRKSGKLLLKFTNLTRPWQGLENREYPAHIGTVGTYVKGVRNRSCSGRNVYKTGVVVSGKGCMK